MLDSNPAHSHQALLRMAETLLARGTYEQAHKAAQQLLQMKPNDPGALEIMGASMLATGSPGQAAPRLRKAIEAGASGLRVHNNLGQALLRLGRLQEAVRAFERVLSDDSGNRIALAGLGQCLFQAGDYRRGAGYFQKLEEVDPSSYQALIGQAQCFYCLNELPTALHYYERVLDLTPEDEELQAACGQLMALLSRPMEAVHYLEPLYENPRYRQQVRSGLIHALISQPDLDKAEAVARETLTEEPDHQEAREWLAQVYNFKGRNEEALALLEEQLNGYGSPSGNGWLLLQNLRGLSAGEVQHLEGLFQQDEIGAVPRGVLGFAVAEWYEKRQDYARQIEWLHTANALISETRYFDQTNSERYLEHVRINLSRPALERLASGGDREWRPVFILGLPRSGTTLLEQILGAHPELEPAGENSVMNGIFRKAGFESKGEGIACLDPNVVTDLARRYRSYMTERYGHARIVEKCITNPRDTGLLYALFPEAKFVQIRRHPLDVALGCYKQLFSQQNFSFDVENIAHEMRMYDEFMAHWEEHLPVEIHTLDYESLVRNLEGQVRKTLEDIDLEFDDRCLRFDETSGAVATASTGQVRQGLFSSGLHRWQRYGDLVVPFREVLEDQGVHVPDH